MCREKHCVDEDSNVIVGSPLRVQGKVAMTVFYLSMDRITPACAGKSGHRDFANQHPEDHPCVCREKLIIVWRWTFTRGSPLRVQGKGNELRTRMWAVRITPACAGKRQKFIDIHPILEDHPCVCREKICRQQA